MNEQVDVSILSNTDKMELYSDDYPLTIPLMVNKFENEKEFFKFTKNCEKLIRSSNEYKEWRDYLVNVLKDNFCFISHEINNETSIDIHHHPISLYSITKTIINKKLDNNEYFCSFDICLEVMKIHFLNKIGYIPLIKSLHEKFHSGFLKIPINLIKGDYKIFLKEFGNYLDDNDMEIINERISINFSNIKWQRNEYPGLIEENYE